MNFLNRNKKNYIIISNNDIIITALKDNTKYNFIRYDPSLNLKTIDILIVDSEIGVPKEILFKVNIIINLTSQQINPEEIVFTKPINLIDFINILAKAMNDNRLFYAINEDWIYNERQNKLISQEREIYLTDKENNLFKELLLDNKFYTTKNYLKKNIWKYKESTESNTIDTHIYKLKQKLPKDLLELKNSTIFITSKFL